MSKPLDTDGWTDKDSKDPEFRELYERLDFIEAYAQHTDLRVDRVGPAGAIGRADEWESHGAEQLEFLQARGLKPEHRVLDLGCGSGRLARKLVPWLNDGRYLGLDVSGAVLEHARILATMEGWISKNPIMTKGDGTLARVREIGFKPDLIWAHSVVTHLPPELVHGLLVELAQMDFVAFYFTYKPAPEPRRSGLKQFQYPASWFVTASRGLGLEAAEDPKVWPASQRTMKVWRP